MNKKVVQKILVKNQPVGLRLDIYLAETLGVSRSRSQKMISDGLVLVDQKAATAKTLVLNGTKIALSQREKTATPAIKTIFEDKDILVIDKPAGITSHPAPGENETTIAEIFADKYKGKDETGRDMVVHRLDKGTSGVMILAKNKVSRDALVKQFAERKIHKEYLALVRDHVTPEEGVIDMPLARDFVSRNRVAPAEEGKDAKTLYKVIRYYHDYTYVTANPKTGRTHQIRVHFAAIGHPLYGDERYGGKRANEKGLFLHATELSFIHPSSGKRVKYTSPLPENLERVLSTLSIE